MRQNVAVLPIGETLREQRIRAKVDMSEVEETTKIRAKYLRALENEEFDVLPGGAYVKSFLKTYADYLGLDARLLLDAYRTRFEQNEEHEAPIFPRLSESADDRGRRRLVVVAVVLAVLVLGGLALIGLRSEDGNSGESSQSAAPAGEPEASSDLEGAQTKPLRNMSVSLQASSPVWVCMEDFAGKRAIDGKLVLPSDRARRYHGEGGFRLRAGSGGLTVRAGGVSKRLGSRAGAQGLTVNRDKIASLPLEQAPSCR